MYYKRYRNTPPKWWEYIPPLKDATPAPEDEQTEEQAEPVQTFVQ